MSVNSPLARRMPGFDARHATRRARRSRLAVAFVVVIGAGALLYVFLGRTPARPAASIRRSPTSATVPRVVTTLATWRLKAPITRTVVLPWTPASGDQMVILGGATTGGATASGVFGLDVNQGALSQVGYLRNTLDNAAGAVLDGQAMVFGGTTASGTASLSVQGLPMGASASNVSGTVVPEATVLGSLPQPRASATAVTVGATAYLVGGDSGTGPDPDILATSDGRNFSTVAALAVPVDSPAVAVLGSKLYVFGGLATAGAASGHPVNTIQVVNLTTHKVTAAGHLPEPLAGASAVALGQRVLLAGGDSAPPGAQSHGSTTVAGASTSTAAPAASSVSTVWSFDPSSATCTAVGHLSVAVSHAGVAVVASTAWLVGGESGGTAVSAVQSLAIAPSPSHPAKKKN